MSTITKAVIASKNFFARFSGKPDTAVARWREHMANARRLVQMEDTRIISEHDAAKAENERAQARYEADRSREKYHAWHEKRRAFLRISGNFAVWSRTVGSALPRIESLLDADKAKDALREAQHAVGTARFEAEKAAGDAAEAAGISASPMLVEITAKFHRREEGLYYAALSIDNIGRASEGRVPRGLYPFNDYLETALKP